MQGSPETTKQHPQKSKEDTRLTWPIDPTTVVLQTHSIIAMSVVVLMRYEIGFQQLSIRTNGRPAIFLVLQVFSWVDARLSCTQPRGTRTRTRTRTRKRRNRFKSISLLKKLEPRYLARLSTKSEYFSSSTSTVSLSTSTSTSTKRTSGRNCWPR